MVRSLRMAGAALVLGTLALGATGASAHGFGGGFHGGFHGGGFHGIGFHGGWGHGGWGWGHRWGYRAIAFRPYYGGCVTQRFVNGYGELVARRVCY